MQPTVTCEEVGAPAGSVRQPPRWRTSAGFGKLLRRSVVLLVLVGAAQVLYAHSSLGPVHVSEGADVATTAPSSRRHLCACPADAEKADQDNIKLMAVDKSHLTTLNCPISGAVCIKKEKRAFLAFYVVGILYMFVSMAIVCEEFFVPTLEYLAEATNTSMDVAGATFMAAGGSTPEFFIALIATFQESDIGFAAIVGSAVFNVLFVIAICTVASSEPLKLSWWPLTRDCSWYILGLATLVFFVAGSSPQKIDWWEALLLLLEYICYCIFMYYNQRIHSFVLSFKTSKVKVAPVTSNIASPRSSAQRLSKVHFQKPSRFRVAVVQLLAQNKHFLENTDNIAGTFRNGNVKEKFVVFDKDNTGFIEESDVPALLESLGCLPDSRNIKLALDNVHRRCDGKISFEEFIRWYKASEARVEAEARRIFERFGSGTEQADVVEILRSLGHIVSDVEADRFYQQIMNGESDSMLEEPIPNSPTPRGIDADSANNLVSRGVSFPQFDKWYSKSVLCEERRRQNSQLGEGFSIDPPKEETWTSLFVYAFTYPACAVLYITMPDIRRPRNHGNMKIAILAFLLSLVWLLIFSCCLLDWATVVSNTLGIPAAVAGVTVLAAGTSVPDLLSSYVVAKHGEGDMAVSSSIGSNIFDILVGLPVPWLLFTISRQTQVKFQTNSLGSSTLLLVMMLLSVSLIVVIMKWRMTRSMGVLMMILYVIFVAQDILQQLPEGKPILNFSF